MERWRERDRGRETKREIHPLFIDGDKLPSDSLRMTARLSKREREKYRERKREREQGVEMEGEREKFTHFSLTGINFPRTA